MAGRPRSQKPRSVSLRRESVSGVCRAPAGTLAKPAGLSGPHQQASGRGQRFPVSGRSGHGDAPRTVCARSGRARGKDRARRDREPPGAEGRGEAGGWEPRARFAPWCPVAQPLAGRWHERDPRSLSGQHPRGLDVRRGRRQPGALGRGVRPTLTEPLCPLPAAPAPAPLAEAPLSPGNSLVMLWRPRQEVGRIHSQAAALRYWIFLTRRCVSFDR